MAIKIRQNPATSNVRVRIAPSPTGIPHIGNTRTALFNYLFARHNKGKFIVRIEDTDRARFVKEAESAIYEILEWLGLEWDENYVQSERLSIYKEQARVLKVKGYLYEDKGALRFRMPKKGSTEWIDAIGNKKIVFQNKSQEDFVAIKSDGYPTYNFANVVDDHLMKITHVIRGDEFISSTPKHIQLYKAFGWKMPIFAHLPVIVGHDRQKLSKRHGAKSVLDYRDEGFLKEAIINFMALLGWAPKGDKEILSIKEMIKLFDLKDVNTNSPIFNIDKLLWFNGYYIRKMPVSQLISKIKDQRSKTKDVDETLLKKIVPLAQTRMKTLNDFEILASHFFEEPKIHLDQKEKKIAGELYKGLLTMKQPARHRLSPQTTAGGWNNETIIEIFKKIMDKQQIRMPVLYKILTGQESGLPLPESLEILGRERTLERLKKILEYV